LPVIGAADTTPEEYGAALTVGRLIARHHETLVCGGLGGVMEAACKGAKGQDGLTIGIVPDTSNGNGFLDIVIRTGLGHARNVPGCPSLLKQLLRLAGVTVLYQRLQSH